MISHSMDDDQVKRISKALSSCANAIQGINQKFDMIDEHIRQIDGFNDQMGMKVDKALASFQRLDDTFNERAELALEAVIGASEGLSDLLESSVDSLQRVNVKRELEEVPKAFMLVTIPIVILLIELAVSNAYMGVLLASMSDVRGVYSNYLLGNATVTLLGLMISLFWLGIYRVSLSWPSRSKKKVDEVRKKRKRRSRRVSQPLSQTPMPEHVEWMDGPQEGSGRHHSVRRSGAPSGVRVTWSRDAPPGKEMPPRPGLRRRLGKRSRRSAPPPISTDIPDDDSDAKDEEVQSESSSNISSQGSEVLGPAVSTVSSRTRGAAKGLVHKQRGGMAPTWKWSAWEDPSAMNVTWSPKRKGTETEQDHWEASSRSAEGAHGPHQLSI